MEHKISLFADDMTLYLSEPTSSLAHLQVILTAFSKVFGLKINESKLEWYRPH